MTQPLVQPSTAPLILVIDDDAQILAMIGRLLSRAGYRVELAADGETGVALFREHANAVKLVVLDWYLPGKFGTRTFDEIINIRQDARVVLVTGDANADLGPRARRDLACLLLKPFNVNELMIAVNAVIQA